MIKEHFALTNGERNGLFAVLVFILLYIGFIKYRQVSFQPEIVDLSALQDSVNTFYNSTPQPFINSSQLSVQDKPSFILPSGARKARREQVCIEINGASKKDLLKIVGVGEYFAQKIIDERQKIGGFSQLEQLLVIYGMDQEKLDDIAPQIKIDKSLMQAPVPLNSADTLALATIYGIDSYSAKRIVDYRNRLGGFYSKEQLMEVYGIGQEKYGSISGRLVLDSIELRLLDINNATFKEVMKHPYVGSYECTKAIFRYLDFGSISSWEEFCKIPRLEIENFEGLRHYIVFQEQTGSL
jgi:competence protein ComEA